MPPADFQLESVLKVRTAERDEQQTCVAEADRIVQSTIEQITLVKGQVDAARDDMRSAVCQQTLEISIITGICQRDSDLRRELRQLESQRVQAVEAAERSRAELTDADARVRSLQRLSDRRESDQRYETQRRETRLILEQLASR